MVVNHPETFHALTVTPPDKGGAEISWKTVGLIAGGVLLLFGAGIAYKRMEEQRNGIADASHLLPDPEGEEYEDGEDDDTDDTEE